MSRNDARPFDQLRPLRISHDVSNYAASSVLFEMGRTKVFCAVTLSNSVPHFLKGKKTGWLSAEYSMLPTSTHVRIEREAVTHKRNGRFIEISRLIGRVLRSVLDLEKLGERTIVIDCDVLQADGSTRTACITSAYFALQAAVGRWLKNGRLKETILRDDVAAVSVGLHNGKPLLDLNYAEDSSIDADFNFIMTRAGNIVEIQGSAEQAPITWDQFMAMREVAVKGIQDIFAYTDKLTAKRAAPFNQIRLTPQEKTSQSS